MKPILQSLKKYSYLASGAPLLVFLLPFVGQGWSLTIWKNCYWFTFAPVFYLLGLRLGIKPTKKFWSPHLLLLFAQIFISFGIGDFAFTFRESPFKAILGTSIMILFLGLSIALAPKMRDFYDSAYKPNPSRMPFDLSAETFRLPPQSNEPADYPRI
ncbi:MAG: hypothetical protein WCI55_12690 [Armatimonadota bacterium]